MTTVFGTTVFGTTVCFSDKFNTASLLICFIYKAEMLVGLIAKHLSYSSFYSSISSIYVYTRWSKGYPELKQNKPEIFKDWVSQNIKI